MGIMDINQHNVAKTGFFCKMSQKKAPGYQRKLRWLQARFAEGLKMKMLDFSQEGRGFIEYIPGEYAWRPVEAGGYMFVHCLWVTGTSKNKGNGSLLLEECISDARRMGMHGVATVTSAGSWMAGKQLFNKHGFETVDHMPPTFELLVKPFDSASLPTFSKGQEDRIKRCGSGLTVFRTDQCPYLDDAVEVAMETARERGLDCRVVELNTVQDVREMAPTPYGVFSLVLNSKLLSYHYIGKKELNIRLDEAMI